jgi:hypothetical protein
MDTLSTLNNREIATTIWLAFIFLFASSKNNIRHAMLDVLKAFFDKRIIVPFIVMLFYIVLMIVGFKKIGFWDVSAIKDTIFWVLGSAIVVYFSLNNVAQDKNYFKNLILDNIKLVLILEFVVNLYSFSLIVELIVVPVVSWVVLLNLFAESNPKYEKVNKLLNFLLGVFGICLLVFTFREIILDFQNFATFKNLRDFLLPPLFTSVFLPFIYVMALFMQYQSLFIRIDFANQNSDIAVYAKRKVLAVCHINLSRLNEVIKKAGYPRMTDKQDVLEWFKQNSPKS